MLALEIQIKIQIRLRWKKRLIGRDMGRALGRKKVKVDIQAAEEREIMWAETGE